MPALAKPLLRYPGGASKSVRILAKYVPPHRVYVEPFCGMASMFFAKELAEVNVLNDANPSVIELLHAVRTGRISKCFPKGVPITREDRLRYMECRYVDSCCEFGARESSYHGSPEMGYIGDVAASKKRYVSRTNLVSELESYIRKLRKARLSVGDFEPVMVRYDSVDTFHFLDPPWTESKEEYAVRTYDVSKPVLERIVDVCKNIIGKVMVLYSGSTEFIDLFREIGYQVSKFRVIYSSTTGVGSLPTYRVIATNWRISI